jgi:predicted TIM-barrel fold metal-dependent hydrolase
MPTTLQALEVHLGLSGARPVDTDAMTAAVAGANAMVAAYWSELPDPLEAGVVWPTQADQAATIQAARLYGRRGSVQGVAAFQDIGVSMLPRLDPDVRALLQVGEYQPSVVA